MRRLCFLLSILLLATPARAQQHPVFVETVLSAANAGTCAQTTTACAVLLLGDFSAVAVQVTANGSANTIQFEVTAESLITSNTVWVALKMQPTTSTTTASSTTSTGYWMSSVIGSAVRVRMSTLAGGTTTVRVRTANGIGTPPGN